MVYFKSKKEREEKMKTLQLKTGIAGFFLALFALANIALTQPAQALSGAEKSAKYQQVKSEINRDLAAITRQRENIEYLESQCSKYRKEGNDRAQASIRQALIKARADLKREKAYLRADKDELLYAYKLAIRTHRDEIKNNKKQMNAYRDLLDQNLRSGNTTEASRYAVLVAQYSKKVKDNQLALQQEKKNRNDDILAINKRVQQTDGEAAAVLYSENAAAGVKNLNFNKLVK